MFVQRTSGQVTTWFVTFERDAPGWWKYLIPGEFKHVRAFGYCPRSLTYVLIDPKYAAMDVFLAPQGEIDILRLFTAKAVAVLELRAQARPRPNLRLVGCCTSTVRDLLGLPGYGPLSALPDVLYRDCIRAGATVCVDNRGHAGLNDPRSDRGSLNGWRRWWRQRRAGGA